MGEDLFVVLEELLGDCFDIEGTIELIGDHRNGGFVGFEFPEAEGEFGEPLDGGTGRGADLVRQGAQFDFAVTALSRPGEGSLLSVAGDVAEQVFGVEGLEGFLHSASHGDAWKPVLGPIHAEGRQP